MSAVTLTPWRIGAIPSIGEEGGQPFAAYLIERLFDLERAFEELRVAGAYGPVPGAYLTFKFSSDIIDTFTAPRVADLFPVPAAFRPIAFSAFIDDAAGGDIEIQLAYDDGGGVGVNILAQNMAINSTVQTWAAVKNRSDFAVDTVPTDALLYVNVESIGAVTSKSPTYLRCMCYGKWSDRVEPRE